MKLKKRDITKSKTEANMKRLFRRNQIIITTLAIMIAAAGYLNYAGKEELGAGGAYEAGLTDISEEDLLAENQAAGNYAGDGQFQEIASLDQDGDDLDQLDGKELADAGQTGETEPVMPEDTDAESEGTDVSQTGLENPGEAVLTSGLSVSDYIANVQLNREQIRAKNKEALMEIVNNTAIEEIAEKENAAETLLMAKGFSDPVVSISSDKVDVVVNASSITDPQRAQIEDIVKRKTEVGADQIVITLLDLEE